MDFKFPDVGEGITEGKLIKWLVKEGEMIKVDQSVAEVETDKAVVEIPSPVNGKVEKLMFKEQDTLNVGKVMMVINDGEASVEPAPEPVKEEVHEEKEEEVKEEEIHETVEKSKQPEIKVEEKKEIQPENPIKKYNSEILALPSVRKFAKQHNINLSTIKGTGKNGLITKKDLEIQTGNKVMVPVKTELQQQSKKESKEILATPSTRKLARELHVDITEISGSGDHGLITKDDIKNASEGKKAKPIPKTKVNRENLEIKPQKISEADEEIVPMSKTRSVIAEKMMESKQHVAEVTHTDEVDITEIFEIREREKGIYKEKGVHLTYLPFFMKAVLIGLKKHPYLNSEMNQKNQEIILKKYYNIGFATDTEEGLLVPVVKNVEDKSIVDIANEISNLASKARERKLTLEDMNGGTFTITSVGGIGGQVFTPIINYPQTAILGIGKIIDKPVVKDGKIVIRKMCMLSLTFDHRVFDGAESARFLKTVMDHLEDPNLLFMEMI